MGVNQGVVGDGAVGRRLAHGREQVSPCNVSMQIQGRQRRHELLPAHPPSCLRGQPLRPPAAHALDKGKELRDILEANTAEGGTGVSEQRCLRCLRCVHAGAVLRRASSVTNQRGPVVGDALVAHSHARRISRIGGRGAARLRRGALGVAEHRALEVLLHTRCDLPVVGARRRQLPRQVGLSQRGKLASDTYSCGGALQSCHKLVG